MLIDIEGSTVYYFFMFLSIIMVPIFFYCYRLLMRIMHYYAMIGAIEQFGLTFRNNEDLIRDASRSVFGLVQRLEEHCYNYYYMTNIGSVVGSVYNSFMNFVSSWFNKNNSCPIPSSDCCGNYGFHQIPPTDCVYTGPNPNWVYAPAPEEYFLQKLASQKLASQKPMNYNVTNRCSPGCQCSPCNCSPCNCSNCSCDCSPLNCSPCDCSPYNPLECPGCFSTGIPCFAQNVASRPIDILPKVSPTAEYCPTGCKIDRRTWGNGADIHDKYYMPPKGLIECAEFSIGDWMTRRKPSDDNVEFTTSAPNIKSNIKSNIKPNLKPNLKSILRERSGNRSRPVRKTLARTRRTPRFYSKNYIPPYTSDNKYLVDSCSNNIPLVGELSESKNAYIDGISPETDGIRVRAIDDSLDCLSDCLSDCSQNQFTNDPDMSVNQTLNNMFGSDVVTNSFEDMLEMANKFDDVSNPSTIDYRNLTLADVMLELVRIAKDLEFNIESNSYASVAYDISSKLSKYLDNPGPNQKVADFIRLTCYSGLGPERFMEKYLQYKSSKSLCKHGRGRVGQCADCSRELLCPKMESPCDIYDSPTINTNDF